MKKLLNYEEAASFLGVTVGSLKGLVRRNFVSCIMLSPRVIRFDEEELQRLVEMRKVKLRR